MNLRLLVKGCAVIGFGIVLVVLGVVLTKFVLKALGFLIGLGALAILIGFIIALVALLRGGRRSRTPDVLDDPGAGLGAGIGTVGGALETVDDLADAATGTVEPLAGRALGTIGQVLGAARGGSGKTADRLLGALGSGAARAGGRSGPATRGAVTAAGRVTKTSAPALPKINPPAAKPTKNLKL